MEDGEQGGHGSEQEDGATDPGINFGPGGRRVYSPEFKARAVKLALQRGTKHLTATATELDISSTILGRWIRESRARGGFVNARPPTYQKKPPTGPSVAAAPKGVISVDTSRLRAELLEVIAERDMLKQMLAHYLAKK